MRWPSIRRMAGDDRVLLMGEDIADPGGGVSGVTAGLSTKYGADRVLDTPISEAAIVGAAIGAALEGMLVVPEIMIMDFIGIAIDQIVNHAAKLRFMSGGRTTCPITVRTAVFGGLGSGRHPLAVPRGVVHAHSRAQGHRAEHSPGRQGPPHVGHLRSRSVRVHGDRPHLRGTRARARRSRLLDPARRSRRQARRAKM